MNPRITRFLLISNPRSGTMMLTDALDESPKIKFYNLYAVEPARSKQYWKNWLRFQFTETKGVTHVGTTMHRVGDAWLANYDHIPTERFWGLVRDHHEKYICLHRKNILRQFLSRKVGTLLKSFDVHKPRVSEVRAIAIDPNELREFITTTLRLQERIDQHFPDRLVVTYEELVDNWQVTFSRVQQYLGLALTLQQPITLKQENRSLHNSIENYDEIADHVTKWGYRQQWL